MSNVLKEDDLVSDASWQPMNIEEELERFRKDWLQELNVKQNTAVEGNKAKLAQHEPSIEEQAAYLYLQGAQAEQRGILSEAILYYRRAVQLVPDIDLRAEQLRHSTRRDRNESESSVYSSDTVVEEDDLSDLMLHFVRIGIQDRRAVCEPEAVKSGMHISSLPQELIMNILKWIVSSDLDILSLAQFAKVCRGFYMCANDEELWKLICRRMWKANYSKLNVYGTFRNMFISRPHVKWNGCYIGKVSYFREGEPSLDFFYRPYHLVEYYRYVRFFPSGEAIMVTSPEEPQTIIPQLRFKGSRLQGMLYGYYRFEDDVVTTVLKRRRVANDTSSQFRGRKVRSQEKEKEQTYHAEFVLRGVGCRPNSRLSWHSYTAYNLAGDDKVTEFDLSKKHYPSLLFSHVRSYVAISEASLA